MKTIQLALRSLLHYKQYTIINILGLALSLACVIIIFRYVYGEMTVDRFNRKLNRIYITTKETHNAPGVIRAQGVRNPNNEPAFVNILEHPGIEMYSTFIVVTEDDPIELNNQQINVKTLVVDSNFLKITDYPVILGSAQLSNPHSAMVTQSFAQKVFGDKNPIGETIRYSTNDILTITGVIGETATKSSITFDIILSIDLMEWSYMPHSLVLLYPAVDYVDINKTHEQFYEMASWQTHERNQLFPFRDFYFDQTIESYGNTFSKGNWQHVRILLLVGLLILLVGVVNYVNIHTVAILRRNKELGVKKVFGAENSTIFGQLLVDNLLLIFLALLLGFVFVGIASPMVGNVLLLHQIGNIGFDVALSIAVLVVLPFLTTLYPYYRYRYSTPIDSLRNIAKIRGGGNIRTVFLSFQYVITIVMITVSLFFIKQLNFMLNSDPGIRTENIIQVTFQKRNPNLWQMSAEDRNRQMHNDEQLSQEINQAMNASPLFTQWTRTQHPFRESGLSYQFSYNDASVDAALYMGGVEAFKLFEFQLLEGRIWDDEIDNNFSYDAIVSESLLKALGISDYSEALIQPARRLWWIGPHEDNPPYRIVGVLKDMNVSHLSQKQQPIFFMYSRSGGMYNPVIAAIVPGRTQDAIEFLRTLHNETVGGEFSYTFIEDVVRAMYEEDRKIATIYSIFTFIALFISALGLFGMSLFDIQQRRKEIAIRKINGASIADIIRALLKKYFLSLGISFVIAAPIAAYAINRYLEDFAHRASVSWWLFAVALLITAGISLLTLIYQTYKAADQNPAEVVKSE
jgi:ABC-type antimicrobial peptide transport system permease subunit